MAKGINHSWGKETQFDPNRQVAQSGLNQRKASNFHYQQGKSAQEVMDMAPEEWEATTKEAMGGGDTPDQYEVGQLMRAYEHYTL